MVSTPYAVFATGFATYTRRFGLFDIGIFASKWYKIACMWDLGCTFIRIEYMNMFYMHFQAGVPRYFQWNAIIVLT